MDKQKLIIAMFKDLVEFDKLHEVCARYGVDFSDTKAKIMAYHIDKYGGVCDIGGQDRLFKNSFESTLITHNITKGLYNKKKREYMATCKELTRLERRHYENSEQYGLTI